MAIKRGNSEDAFEEQKTLDIVWYQQQMRALQGTIDMLEGELESMRQQQRVVHVKELETQLYETQRELMAVERRNKRLTGTLQEAKEKLQILKEKVAQLSAPPNNYGVFLGANEDDTVDIDISGRKWRVNMDPALKGKPLAVGQEVIVNSGMNVVAIKSAERHGDVVKIKERIEDELAIVSLRTDEERVVRIAESLKEMPLKTGDNVLLNHTTSMLMEKLPKREVEDLLLEEVPDIGYTDIGGLDTQIEAIRDAIELPYLYPKEYEEFNLSPPKGVLLYGPPGCGKTLIARAVASSIAERVRKESGNDEVRGYFINIKGPELLNKYVGETERKIREVFQKARDKSREGFPVIIFFDEMDSLFRSRGMGISSDMESTLVPQFLSEIDGVENLRDVIVIGASNRQDLLDPAVLRPGRLDIKIKIDRPNQDGAKDIFAIYLTPELPFAKKSCQQFAGDTQAVADHFIDEAVREMYATTDDNRFIEVTYARGERETLFFKDFVSGAMIENIVSRAKKAAIKRFIGSDGTDKGMCLEDLKAAIREEYHENEDLPNTTNPDDWAKISGRKGEKIVNIRALINEPARDKKQDTRVTRGGTFL
ncbi:proteasome ATPase [Candidatus Poribacteria bacterium]|nr:proteasome ATPase [Candidatus Poribacteria bacterium]MYH81822.1 proteasome ATPase [Candidatus Poribacteria bacterium]